MAVDILEHARIVNFVENGGAVECQLDVLKCPDHTVWFLQQPASKQLHVTDVNSITHCKVIELPLNFHNVMTRYQCRTLPKSALDPEAWVNKHQ
eukprot:1771489-Lingulodinium_polyedra.AAC.1